MASLNRWRLAAVIVIYLVLVPAAIMYTAIEAKQGLRNDERQDGVLLKLQHAHSQIDANNRRIDRLCRIVREAGIGRC